MAEIISNETYNLLAVLLSKLEGLEAYDQYMEDLSDENKRILEQISRDDERHAELLRSAVEKMVKDGGLK
ncbi:MAG: hypothetical protein M3014_12605 [Chloroflexota bacterium]|nr:hypothetical protein [Chloroflexota bacterium]